MSFRRAFIWHCDECHAEESKVDYKLPGGWTWGDNPVTHLCYICSSPYEVLEDQKRGRVVIRTESLV